MMTKEEAQIEFDKLEKKYSDVWESIPFWRQEEIYFRLEKLNKILGDKNEEK